MSKKNKIITVILFILNIFVGITWIVAAEEINLKDHKVTITDGDTIRAGDYRLRLLYTDAPESTQTCKTIEGKTWKCGVKSKEYLEKLVIGKDIVCRIVGLDRYKRSLAICNNGGIEINQEMVRSGWALAYIRYGSPYKSEQIEAMKGLKGIWNGTFIEPEMYRRLKRAPTQHMTKEFKENLEL